jgi:hypothetical protein
MHCYVFSYLMLLESVYETVSGSYLYGVEACKRLAAEELSLLRESIATSNPSTGSEVQNADGIDEAAGANCRSSILNKNSLFILVVTVQ